jgi:endonuclease YncB( thermonuclease family)
VPSGVVNQPTDPTEAYIVSHVIDGNTLELSNGEQVRFIGIDCAEFKDHARNKRNAERLGIDLKHYASYAQKAKDYLRRIEGAAVKLEHDEMNESARHRDKDDRLLAYVYAYAFAKIKDDFVPDGVSEKWSDDQSKGNVLHLMNAKLAGSGYCTTDRRFDFKYKDKFLELEWEAKKAGRGIWQNAKLSRSKINSVTVYDGTQFLELDKGAKDQVVEGLFKSIESTGYDCTQSIGDSLKWPTAEHLKDQAHMRITFDEVASVRHPRHSRYAAHEIIFPAKEGRIYFQDGEQQYCVTKYDVSAFHILACGENPMFQSLRNAPDVYCDFLDVNGVPIEGEAAQGQVLGTRS